jgi:hypothetical protein
VIDDMTPAYTGFDNAAAGTLGTGITACNVTTAPAVGASGPVRWTLTGALAPGGAGTVTMRVRVR